MSESVDGVDTSDASGPSLTGGHHFAGVVTTFLVESLRREGGDELVDTVLREAGEAGTADELCDPMKWSSYDQVRSLFEATRRVTGNRARLVDLAEEGIHGLLGSAYLEIIQLIGSPSAFLGRLDEIHTGVSAITEATPEERGPCDWRVTFRMLPGFEPFRDHCWFIQGLLASTPRFYGFSSARVVEETCQCEGADACRYRVIWSEDQTEQAGAEHFEFLSQLLAERLGELQDTVAELVSSDDLETILTKIVASAGRAVDVPAYVLALDTLPEATHRVYAQGVDESEAERLAEVLLAGNDPGATRVLACDIRSARRSYGLLAAVDPTGTRIFMPEERAVLEAYASVAAAALEVASSLEDARRETRAAEAMSDMLADERSLLSAIIEGLPHGIGWISSDGVIEGCNQALLDLFGYSGLDEIKGRYWREVSRDESGAKLFEAWAAAVAGGESIINEELTFGPVNNRRVMLVSIVPLVSVSGESGLLSLWADVTTQRALEQRLAEMSRLESIGQLAAGIAHEINTPLQYIGNSGTFLDKSFVSLSSLVDDLQQLAADCGVDPTTVESLTSGVKLDLLRTRIPEATTQVGDGVEAVSRIVRSLKTFAHSSGDRFEEVDLGAALDATMTVSQPEWRQVAKIDLDLGVGDDLPSVRAVPGMINQVFLNLIMNAAEAIDDRRRVEETDELGRITISCREVDGFVEVAVGDDGGGIPDEVRGKIYDQFYTTKPLGKGIGQGLAICRNIVNRHDGTIDYTTSTAGTTFTVRLPVWRPPLTPPLPGP